VSQQPVQLKVLEAYTRDVGRGVARLDYGAMDGLDAKKHLDEAIVTDEHFQEAAKKVRSSRESNPMEKVAVPFYR